MRCTILQTKRSNSSFMFEKYIWCSHAVDLREISKITPSRFPTTHRVPATSFTFIPCWAASLGTKESILWMHQSEVHKNGTPPEHAFWRRKNNKKKTIIVRTKLRSSTLKGTWHLSVTCILWQNKIIVWCWWYQKIKTTSWLWINKMTKKNPAVKLM